MKEMRAPRLEELAGARVLVLGLGRAGTAAARFLLRRGAVVMACEDNSKIRNSLPIRRLRLMGLRLVRDASSSGVDWAVVSPGISNGHPLVSVLSRRGVPLVDELDLSALFVGGPVVAVTGTNGKSTTTVLIARILQAAGKRAFFGGNLAPGRPLATALQMPRQDYYVVEASSFQLERARWFRPTVAVILNVTPDHLNRHGTMVRYAESKFRILDRQTPADFAVLNSDDPMLRPARKRGDAEKRFFSIRRQVRGAWLDREQEPGDGGWLMFDDERIMRASRLRLPGMHNVQNALAAIAAVKLLGGGNRAIVSALASFAGLPHRLEFVRRLDGVDYINNSMCTNPAAGARSLESVAGLRPKRGVVLIAGGRGKGLPMAEYVRSIARQAKWAVLMGETRDELGAELTVLRFRRWETADNLRAAVRAAKAHAGRGDAVLFSPGFASFDQFADFTARGTAFIHEVKRLQ